MGGHADLVHVMTRGAGYTFLGMFRPDPVEVLLVVTLGKLIGVNVFHITSLERNGFIVSLERLSWLVTHWPAGSFKLGGFAAVVAGAADLHRYPHGELGWIDNSLALVEDGGFRQSRVP